VSGKFTPHEIITIPVISNHQTIAIISLSTIHTYNQQTIQLIKEIWVMMNARITGVLAFRQIQALSERLELHNHELNAQKNELSAQAIELNQQNIELERLRKSSWEKPTN
jgi:transcriptional regulator with GAF, ATPase, and Fis domain